MTVNQELLDLIGAYLKLAKHPKTTEKDFQDWMDQAYKMIEKAHKEAATIPPPALTVEHTGVTEPTPRYEDLKAQLEYAEEILKLLYRRDRTCRQCCAGNYSVSHEGVVKFEDHLMDKMAELYLAGAKTPAEFVKAQAGEKQ
jgi:hypothetical protein